MGEAVVQRWRKLTPSAQRAAIGVLLRKPAWTESLLTGVDKGIVGEKDLANEQWQALTTYPQEKLAKKARTLQQAAGQA